MIRFIHRTVKYRREFSAWQEKHDALAPKVGDPAPDFELSDVSGEHRDVSDGHRVRLSDFQGDKPVALVFGSFT
jgi:hypothetical protein